MIVTIDNKKRTFTVNSNNQEYVFSFAIVEQYSDLEQLLNVALLLASNIEQERKK